METKFTKGQWMHEDGVIFTEDIDIAYLYNENITKEEAEENAKLIAAAPELLEVLLEFDSLVQGCHDDPATSVEIYYKMKKAIEKATK